MTQLSRPYQIALLTMALFVAVWFLALRGHVCCDPGTGLGDLGAGRRGEPHRRLALKRNRRRAPNATRAAARRRRRQRSTPRA